MSSLSRIQVSKLAVLRTHHLSAARQAHLRLAAVHHREIEFLRRGVAVERLLRAHVGSDLLDKPGSVH